jgi:hypothetical protein
VKHITIALVLCASACDGKVLPTDEYTVYIDPAFDTKIDDVLLGISEWETTAQANGQPLHIHPVIEYRMVQYDGESGEFSLHPDTLNQIEVLSGHSTYIGYTMRDLGHDRADAFIGSDISDPVEWYTTLKHEMGHCMGLVHVNANVIMYPGWGSEVSRVVTCADVQQYASVRDRRAPACP